MSALPRFEYVRFRVGTEPSAANRLEHLRRAVDALAAAKARIPGGQAEPTDDELVAWRSILPAMAVATFAAAPPSGAWLPPSGLIEPGWEDLSMLLAILRGETRLEGIHLCDHGTAELRFDSLAWPYGGITCLIRLVEAFGFDVIAYDEGSMPEGSRAEHLLMVLR